MKRRAKCPDCGREYNVRQDGRLPNHNRQKSKRRCSGGGTLVGEDRLKMSSAPRILHPRTGTMLWKERRTR
jgi:hypothetical protein